MTLHKSIINKTVSQNVLNFKESHKFKSLSKPSNLNIKYSKFQTKKKQQKRKISLSKSVHNLKNQNILFCSNKKPSSNSMPKTRKQRQTYSFSKKQHFSNDSIIEEQKHKKYIFNQPKASESIKKAQRMSAKSKNNISIIQTKTIPIKTIEIKNNPSKTKLKKKVSRYFKSYTKACPGQKSLSLIGCQKSNQTSTIQIMTHNGLQKSINLKDRKIIQIPCLQLNDEFNSIEIQKLKNLHKQKLDLIQQQVKSLSQNLKQSNKLKLEALSNEYKKIIIELYNIIKIKDANLMMYRRDDQKSTATHSKCQLFSNDVSMVSLNKGLQSTAEQCLGNDTKNSTLIITKNRSLQGKKSKSNSSSTQSLVKKLNLQNLKKSCSIKQYHEEFMQMKQNFSQSWKRQLSKQRKF